MKMTLKPLLFACGVAILPMAIWAPAQAQYPKPEVFSIEKITSSPFPSDLTAAARGSRIAWAFDAEGKRNIWGAEEPQFTARQLTQFNKDDGQEITEVQLSADGRAIVFVRGGNKNSAGEVPNPTSDPEGAEQAVWMLTWPKGGGAERPRKIDLGRSPAISPRGGWVAYVKENKIWLALSSGSGKPKEIVVRGQNSSPTWSPDGKLLAFVSARSTHSLITLFDPMKKTIRYVAPTLDRDGTPRWSSDGKSIAFIRQPARAADAASGGAASFGGDSPNPWAIWTADIASGEAKEIWHSGERPEDGPGLLAGARVLQWAAENRIVFASEMDGWMHLYSIPAAGGEPVLLTPGECEFEHASYTSDLRSIVFSSNCGDADRRHLWRVGVTGGRPEALTAGEGIEWAPVPTGDGKWIAHFASDARVPAMPCVREARPGSKARMISAKAMPNDFPSAKLVAPLQVVIESPDGVKIHEQLFLPAGAKAGDMRPAILFMHGGPMRQMLLGWHYLYYYHNSYAFNQYLASRGYVVMSVNYRSGIGYGRAFRMAQNRGPSGAAEYQDVVAAGKYLAARPEVDPKRVGLWGGSYGGYLTAMGLARNSELFAAGVDLHGVHDWSARGGAPQTLSGERARTARESSPVSSMDTWRSPVILIHGDDDRNVDFNQSVDLIARLRRQKVYVEQLVFPDDIHDFLLHRNWVQSYKVGVSFFEREMK